VVDRDDEMTVSGSDKLDQRLDTHVVLQSGAR
jgi:hypothetical protein